ncbi:putative translational regulatory protein ArgL, partial [Enterobacter hormaechei subsp. hoffmannii]
ISGVRHARIKCLICTRNTF